MSRLLTLLTALCFVSMLTSCRLPRHHAEVMRGTVRGGEVPLYKAGSMKEFFRAGLILPDIGGYARAEFDVLDIGEDGFVSRADGEGGTKRSKTVAQMAIPSLVSSYDLSRTSCEMRAACPVTDQNTGPLLHAGTQAIAAAAPPSLTPAIAAAAPPALTPTITAAAPPALTPTITAAAPPILTPTIAAAAPPIIAPTARPAPRAHGVSPRWATNSYFQTVVVAESKTARSSSNAAVASSSRPRPSAEPLVASSNAARASSQIRSPSSLNWATNSYLQSVSLP